MSGIGDADLVRVRSLDELRVGMTVVLKGCQVCANTHTLILTTQALIRCPGGVAGWTVADNPHPRGRLWCFCDAVPKGTLYRLRDLDAAEEEGRRIGCDIDDRRRVGADQWERSRRVLRGAR